MQFYRLSKPSNNPMFSLKPVKVKVDRSTTSKVGCFAECKDSRGSWKNHYFFILWDNNWGFPGFFMDEAIEGAYSRPIMYEGSTELETFVGLCYFMVHCLEDKVMDAYFPFRLPVFDEATLRQIGCSWSYKLPCHKDRLANWIEGAEGDIVTLFHGRLTNASGRVLWSLFVIVDAFNCRG